MRIISGKLKSFRFSPPKGFPSRPTTDFAKEALFNVLEHRFSLYDLEILDLFAGTGSISLEFASREAGNITTIEKDFRCVKFIQGLTKKYQVDKEVSILKSDVISFLQKTTVQYDIIFADPPFADKIHETIVSIIKERALLTEIGLLIIEHGQETKLEQLEGFQETKRYGGVYFSFFKF